MARVSKDISTGYRYFFYSCLTLSLLTGTGFWLIRNYFMVEGDFGPEAHFLQFPLLQFHGLAAFLMLMGLGAIFANHIPRTWSEKRAKKSGIGFVAAVSFSIISAYSLYYLVGEEWHTLLGNAHAIVGLLLPSVLALHIIVARKSRLNKKAVKYAKRREVKQKRAIAKQEKHLRRAVAKEQVSSKSLATADTHVDAHVDAHVDSKVDSKAKTKEVTNKKEGDVREA